MARTGSLEGLEEYTAPYRQRAGRGAEPREEDHYEMEPLDFGRYPSYRNVPLQHQPEDDSDYDDGCRRNRRKEHNISPLPSPQKRRGHWDTGCLAPPTPRVGPPSSTCQEEDYDGAFLSSLLDRKAKLRSVGRAPGGVQGAESDTASRGSSKKNGGGGSTRHSSQSPSPQSDGDWSRTERPSPRATRTCSPPLLSASRHDDTRHKPRKVVSHRRNRLV